MRQDRRNGRAATRSAPRRGVGLGVGLGVGSGMSRTVSRAVGLVMGLMAVVVAGCGSSTEPEIEGVCLAGVQVGGLFYAHEGVLPSGLEAGERVATVAREVGCYDTPGVGDPDDHVRFDGDSNFLPVGTGIHLVQGRARNDVLAALHQGEWLLLVAEEDTSEPTG